MNTALLHTTTDEFESSPAPAPAGCTDAGAEFLQLTGPGLLASRSFWAGGLLSVAAWSLLAYLITSPFGS